MALRLRPTGLADLPAVMALEADADVAPWITAWTRERHVRAISDGDEAHMVFCDGGRRAGFLLLAGVSGEQRSIELRRIALVTRGAGIGACALTLALDHAFGALAARRVWLDLLAANTRALRVYERAGFVEEGLFDGAHLLPDGSRAPLRIMSIRRAQWERRDA